MEKKSGYQPRGKNTEILNWLLKRVQSVPYSVSGRWAFYQCVEELGMAKSMSKDLGRLTGRARKARWNGWAPWTLRDDTRQLIQSGGGFADIEEWIDEIKKISPTYEKFSMQDSYVVVMFEAEAMRSQFVYYVSPYHIPMAPFKGDPSIDYKWRIAKFLSDLQVEYGKKPVTILYFGDYETDKNSGSRARGMTIPISALKDIEPWFYELQMKRGVDEEDLSRITFERCGLNKAQIEEWNLPSNPERPGEYQWEALSDDRAGGLIVESLKKHLNVGAILEVEEKEKADAERWRVFMNEKWRN